MEGQFPAVPDIRVTLLGRFAVTVTATWERAGMVPEIATMVVLCSLWRLMPQRYGPVLPGPSLPAGPGEVQLLK